MFRNLVINAHVGQGVVAALIVLAAAELQPYRLVVVQGESMVPTYANRSVQAVTRSTGHLYKGEVVVLKTEFGTLIKRIAYLPGDTIRQMLVGDKWTDLIRLGTPRRKGQYFQIRNYKIPENEVYVLGDNRVGSIDSTTFGAVPIKDVWGVLVDQEPRLTDKRDNEYGLLALRIRSK